MSGCRLGVVRVGATVVCAILVCANAPLAAQLPGSPRSHQQGCGASEYRQLDSWIGHWYIVTDEGRLQGESDVSRATSGCGFAERWHGVSGGHGRSLSVYDPGAARWRYLFVNDTGLVLVAEGAAAGPGLTWTVTHLSEPTAGQLEQWNWSTAGGIRHIVRASRDSGKTWDVRLDVWYRPWAGALPPNSRHNGPCHVVGGYRSLDFMVGDWDVMAPTGARVAESRVDTVLQGCAVLERERTAVGASSMQLMGWDGSVGVWRAMEQTSAGGGTRLDGAVGSEGVTWMPADGSAAASGVMTRRHLTRRADGTLLARVEASADSGRTWETASERIYRRRARSAL